VRYLWWFFANQWQRRRDHQTQKMDTELVYSPGINCMDADVIVVHIVFHAFYEQVRNELGLRRASPRNWPRLMHRKLYYKLIMALERRVYHNRGVRLVAVSPLLARQLGSHFGRTDVTVIPNAVDTARYSESIRVRRRIAARTSLDFGEDEFVVLLIGNDWKKKGLNTLLRACAQLPDIPLRVLVVGSDDPALFLREVEELNIMNRVRFEKPSSDVMLFYAAADLYAGPSLEDSFSLPILEAMACGLPVIASANAGASEFIRDGQTGCILQEPRDHGQLANLIEKLYLDSALRTAMGEAASRSVGKGFSWDKNVAMTRQVLEETVAHRK
jgi:UDP-glucose:(heptosyl)LPS alpha-1,3-glucosyltransferase